MGLFWKKKYIVILARKMSGKYQEVGKKKNVKPTDTSITWEKKTIPVSFDSILYEDNNKTYIMVDVDTLQPVEGEAGVNKIPLKLVKAIVKDGVVHQLITRLGPSGLGLPLIMLLMTILAGVFIGYFLGSVMPYYQIQQAIQNFHW